MQLFYFLQEFTFDFHFFYFFPFFPSTINFPIFSHKKIIKEYKKKNWHSVDHEKKNILINFPDVKKVVKNDCLVLIFEKLGTTNFSSF